MRILFVSSHPFDYNRVLVLKRGLAKRNDVYIEEFIIQSKFRFDKKKFRELTASFDFIYIPPFRHNDVRFIKKRTDTPVIFDPLISKYLTSTDDHAKPWKGPKKYLIDAIALWNADHLLCDTEAHKSYFRQKFKLKDNNISTLPVGVDTDMFHPASDKDQANNFTVGFYGTFVPLQGVPKIIDAAEMLIQSHPDIKFVIIGNGKVRAAIEQDSINRELTNIEFTGFLDYKDLPRAMQGFDVCLGIFGESLKANLVVPNKVFHYAALSKCFISAETDGIKEVFTHHKNAFLCASDVSSICQAIIELKENEDLRAQIGSEARKHMVESYNEDKIAERFIEILNKQKQKMSD